jgi:hypothetical protein
MNPLIPLMGIPDPQPIMTPFQLAEGKANIEGQQLNNEIKRKSLQPQELSEKEKIETAISRTAYVAQRLQGFVGKPYSPQLDAQYRQTKAQIEQELGTKMSTLPDKYDPDTIANGYKQGMSVAENLMNAHRQFQQGMEAQKFEFDKGFKQNEFGYRQQHDQDVLRAQQENQRLGRDITMRGQDIQASNQGWSQTVGPDGLPVWTQKRSEGMPVYSPTGISNKPLPTGQAKQVLGVKNLNDGIDEYIKQLENFKITDLASPDARAGMGTKYNNMMLQAKEAYNLGVLNGPDFEILTSVITDPRSFTGAITSNEALKNQAMELKRIMNKIQQTSGSIQMPGSGQVNNTQEQQEEIPPGWNNDLEAEYNRLYGGQ